MKVRESKQYSLPRALNETGLVVGRPELEQFLAVRDECFNNHPLSILAEDDATILEDYIEILKRGYDLGSVALGVKDDSTFIAGIAMFGSTYTDNEGLNVAQISLSGSFASEVRPEAVTSTYGKRLRPALLAIAGASLVEFYGSSNLAVEFVTEAANEALALYYQSHGFDFEEPDEPNLAMSLRLNPESIRTLYEAAQA